MHIRYSFTFCTHCTCFYVTQTHCWYVRNKSDMWPGKWKHDLGWSLLYCPPCISCLPHPSTRDTLIVHHTSQCCCCNARLAKSVTTGSAGWQAIKLQSSHWYQQTSLSILMGLRLHCVQCTCSCKQTTVGIHVQIIPLTGTVLRSSMQIDGIIQ